MVVVAIFGICRGACCLLQEFVVEMYFAKSRDSLLDELHGLNGRKQQENQCIYTSRVPDGDSDGDSKTNRVTARASSQ